MCYNLYGIFLVMSFKVALAFNISKIKTVNIHNYFLKVEDNPTPTILTMLRPNFYLTLLALP